jgi:hypothetical protein
MVLVATLAYAVPKIFPTIIRWRGIPLRILLYNPWKTQTVPIRI